MYTIIIVYSDVMRWKIGIICWVSILNCWGGGGGGGGGGMFSILSNLYTINNILNTSLEIADS